MDYRKAGKRTERCQMNRRWNSRALLHRPVQVTIRPREPMLRRGNAGRLAVFLWPRDCSLCRACCEPSCPEYSVTRQTVTAALRVAWTGGGVSCKWCLTLVWCLPPHVAQARRFFRCTHARLLGFVQWRPASLVQTSSPGVLESFVAS